jgi:hypothetical protein
VEEGLGRSPQGQPQRLDLADPFGRAHAALSGEAHQVTGDEGDFLPLRVRLCGPGEDGGGHEIVRAEIVGNGVGDVRRELFEKDRQGFCRVLEPLAAQALEAAGSLGDGHDSRLYVC